MLCQSDRRNRRMATKISEHSHTFWYVLRLVRTKNPGPLRFKLTRFHCIWMMGYSSFLVIALVLTLLDDRCTSILSFIYTGNVKTSGKKRKTLEKGAVTTEVLQVREILF